jgi:creatinine amidohydrolase
MSTDAPGGAVLALDELTWTETRDLDRGALVALLPVGAVEAHGPHLPTSTDRVIAVAMAREGGRRLAARGLLALLLPPIDYTAAPFAAGFPGTVSVRPETVTALVADVAASLAAHGVRYLGLANAHLDPTHLGSLHAAVERIGRESALKVAFPDVTRKPWAPRLTDEFKSGACHAGRYEGSIVLARRPDLVRQDRMASLPARATSLAAAIRDGATTFEEIGGHDAYFGDPAAATAAEGEATIAVLGAILEEAVVEMLAEVEPSPAAYPGDPHRRSPSSPKRPRQRP